MSRVYLASAVVILWIFQLRVHAFDASGVSRDDFHNSRESVCDPMIWKTTKDLPRFVDALVNAWCNASSQDAIQHARVAKDELLSCNHAQVLCWSALEQCEEDRNNTVLKLAVDRAKQHPVCEEEKLLLESKFSVDREESHAQIAYWKEKCQNRISIAECNYQKQAAFSDCQLQNSAQLKDIEGLKSHSVRLGLEQSQLDETELKSLEETLASCRLQKAYADANLAEADEVVRKLKSHVQMLYGLLAACGTLLFGIIPGMICLQILRKGEKQGNITRKCDSLQVLTAEQTHAELVSMFERGNGVVRPILTSLVTEGKELFFLLVPFNSYRRRMFTLFGGGGDYSWEVEASRNIVADRTSGSLFIILYDHGGHAFSETTLYKLRMDPEHIAQKAVPRDSDFPTRQDIGVLWMSSEELILTNGDGDSVFPDIIEEQAWIHCLGR